MNKQRIAIFASGTGSNALNLIQHFSGHPHIEVALVFSNKQDAPIVPTAKNLGICTITASNVEASNASFLVDLCNEYQVNWVVLAGYLRLIPAEFIAAFERKMINLHPSLLPKYGGKGMYGSHVHKAVLENKESTTGITIHFVNSEFDKGEIIAQFHTPVASDARLADVEGAIRYLEQSYLPIVIEKTIMR